MKTTAIIWNWYSLHLLRFTEPGLETACVTSQHATDLDSSCDSGVSSEECESVCLLRSTFQCYHSVLPSHPIDRTELEKQFFSHWWDKSLNKNNTRNMGLFGSQWEGSIPPGRKEQLLTLYLRSASGEVNTGAQFTFFLLFSPGPELMEGNCPCLGQTFLSQLT